MTQRQSLSVDLDALFPGTSVMIGDQPIIIRPLGLEQLSILSKQAIAVAELLSNKGITWENFNVPKNLAIIAVTLLQSAPELLEEASNIELADLKKLPIELIVVIVEAIITENLKAKDGMEKNLQSLIKKFRPETSDEIKRPGKPAKKKRI